MTERDRANLVAMIRCAADLCLTGRETDGEITTAEIALRPSSELTSVFTACGAFARRWRRPDILDLHGEAKGLELLEVAAWVEDDCAKEYFL